MFVFTKWRTVSVFLPTANIWATLEKKSNTNLYTTKKQIITCNLFIKRKKLLWTYSGQIIVTCSLLALNGYNTHVYMSKSIQYTCSHAYTIYKNWDQSMYFWRTFILSIKKMLRFSMACVPCGSVLDWNRFDLDKNISTYDGGWVFYTLH